MTSKKQTPEEMDSTVVEESRLVSERPHARECYALTTLVDEVKQACPNATYQAGEPDWTNAALEVEFAGLDEDTMTALDLINEPARVEYAMRGEEVGTYLVRFRGYAVTKDSRTPFGIPGAVEAMR